MKLDRLETHDRLIEYQKQQKDLSDGVLECIRNVPDAVQCPFYVYGHSRSVDYDEKINIVQTLKKRAPDSRIIWMPVVTKPKAAPNTYLFLCRKNSDIIEIIWMLPKRELWDQYKPGQMCHNENIWISIQNYLNDKERLNAPDKNGPTEKDIEHFRKVIGHEAHQRKKMRSLAKQGILEASSVSFD